MSEITDKNTKAEILAAYMQEVAEKNDLKQKVSEFESKQGEMFVAELSEKPNCITVVIPYVKKFSQGNELQLAIRGWAENFKEEFNLVIVGDREPWMNDNIIVIDSPCVGTNPPIDIANKLLKVIECPDVSEKFIWANDDQYLVTKCMLADFETLKCSGKLGKSEFGGTLYQQNKKRTYSLLKSLGLGLWDFSTHTPIVYEKKKLAQLIDEANLTKEAYLIATLYFNLWFDGFVPYKADGFTALEHDNLKVGVYRKNADYEKLKDLMTKKKIVSNSQSGWTEELSKILNNRFKVKCRFEK